jgi:UDP-N-acetylmuramoyl-tripeptide--D-alanyl-D-alanine ligase
MMMLSEIAKAVDGTLIIDDMRLGADVRIESVDTDSRRIQAGQLFVGIRGERFDGNTFAAEALTLGAAAVMISDDKQAVSPAVLVADTRLALGKLAHYWRQQLPAPITAITGSNGKTTTKEMLSAILVAAVGDSVAVHATQGNFNNDIGLPLTLLKARAHHQQIVLEMGMNHLGEIAYLSNLAQPNVAVINNAGTAHIGELGSRKNIAQAKGEIFEGLTERGVAVINADDAFADYWRSLNPSRKVITFALKKPADITATYSEDAQTSQVNLTTPNGSVSFQLPILGVHNIYNALAASAAAVVLGIENQAIATGLAHFGGVHGRLEYKQGYNGAVLIDDTYNANPDSMKAAIDVLSHLNTTRIFVMGDMGELGTDAVAMHAALGAYAHEHQIQHFFSLGENSQHASNAFGSSAQHFTEVALLANHVKPLMKSGVTVLVKGSRYMKMERVVALLEAVNNQQQSTQEQTLGRATCC